MNYHLLGIGGVGMSALATALVREGYVVSGSDRTLGTANIRFLESLGVKVYPDDGSGITGQLTDELIVSTAIEATNPGLVRARALGIPVVHRAQALARALANYKLVAVVGTCGKSTVTAMLGHVLTSCGLDPCCVNGANVPGWEGAVRFGRGEYAVAEVDESDKSLVAFKPYAAIVTNASADHYSKEEMDAVFDSFIADLPGPLVDGRVSTVALEGEFPNLLGAHNRQNAALAIRMAVALGVKLDDALAAMRTFRGVERRLQPIASAPVAIYDDYAHNPEKLRAMLLTLQERYPKGVLAIWRPHGYGPLRKMLSALAEMFAATLRPQDELLVLPVYDVGGTADRSLNSSALISSIAGLSSVRVSLVADLGEAYARALVAARSVGTIVTCGARDPGLPLLARRLATSFALLARLPSLPVARTFFSRLRGLMGTKFLPSETGLYFPCCNAIHTCFMRYPITAIFLDAKRCPVHVVTHVPPWRFFVWGTVKARHVLELAAVDANGWV